MDFDRYSNEWMAKTITTKENEVEKTIKNSNTPLGYAIEKMKKRRNFKELFEPVTELREKFDENIQDIQRQNAVKSNSEYHEFIYDIVKGKNGEDVQMLKFTYEGAKKRDEMFRERGKKFKKDYFDLMEKEVEVIDPYFVSEIPDNLTKQEKEAFMGIVIANDCDK